MTVFLGVDDVVQLHDVRAPEAPLLDAGKLDGALHRPANREAYDAEATIHDLAAVLFEGIIAAHAFEDGNKRTAVVAVYAFYLLNGYVFDRASDPEIVDIARDVATGDIDAEKIAPYFEHWAHTHPDEAGA